MDGHNVSLDNFLLVIWVFLNVCPEPPAINPFLEAKQKHRERKKKKKQKQRTCLPGEPG